MLKKIGLIVLVLSFVFVMGAGSANAVTLTLGAGTAASDAALALTGGTTASLTGTTLLTLTGTGTGTTAALAGVGIKGGSAASTIVLGGASQTGAIDIGDPASDAITTVNIGTGPLANVINIGSKVVTGTLTKIMGALKVDTRLSGAGGTLSSYATQIRSEYAGTGATEHNGLDSQSNLVASGAATLIGVKGVVDVDTGITDTGGALIAVYGQARSTGTLNSATGQLVGVYGLLGNSAALTVGQAAAGWFNSDQVTANAITGEHELLLLTNSGTATLDQAIYVDGNGVDSTSGGGVGTFIKFTNGTSYTDGVKVTATTPSATASALIKINIAGTTYYIPAYAAGEVTNE